MPIREVLKMIAIPNMEMPETCDMCPIEGCEYINGKFTCPIIDIVRCGECKWYEPRHIEENGIECAGQCIWHIGLKTYCDAHDRENPEDRPRMIIFREPTDFCSYGERRSE